MSELKRPLRSTSVGKGRNGGSSSQEHEGQVEPRRTSSVVQERSSITIPVAHPSLKPSKPVSQPAKQPPSQPVKLHSQPARPPSEPIKSSSLEPRSREGFPTSTPPLRVSSLARAAIALKPKAPLAHPLLMASPSKPPSDTPITMHPSNDVATSAAVIKKAQRTDSTPKPQSRAQPQPHPQTQPQKSQPRAPAATEPSTVPSMSAVSSSAIALKKALQTVPKQTAPKEPVTVKETAGGVRPAVQGAGAPQPVSHKVNSQRECEGISRKDGTGWTGAALALGHLKALAGRNSHPTAHHVPTITVHSASVRGMKDAWPEKALPQQREEDDGTHERRLAGLYTKRRWMIPVAIVCILAVTLLVVTPASVILGKRPASSTALGPLEPVNAPSPSPSPTRFRRPPTPGPPFCATCVQIVVGTPEFVTWPNFEKPHYPDFAFASTRMDNGTIIGFSGKGTTDVLVLGSELATVLDPPMPTSLQRGAPYYWTHNVQSAIWDERARLLRAWVHVECNTNGSFGWFHGEIVYTESVDGINWSPSQFRYTGDALADPDNYYSQDWCITSSGPYQKTEEQVEETRSRHTGTGVHWVVRIGNFYYAYFTDFWAEQSDGSHTHGFCMARSSVRQGGKPRTWLKWYQNDFTEPGVGGRCTPVKNVWGASVIAVPIPGLATILGAARNSTLYFSFPTNNLGRASISTDGIFWRETGHSLWPTIQSRDDSIDSMWQAWYLGYTSAHVDERGQFWLYVMHQEAQSTLRHIVRYPIAFRPYRNATCASRFALTRWISVLDDNRRTTIEAVDPRIWDNGGVVGYTTVCERRVRILLVECRIVRSGRYFLTHQSHCNSSSLQYIGSVGYVRREPSPGSVPLYRCYDASQGIFDTSTRGCPQGWGNTTLGWIGTGTEGLSSTVGDGDDEDHDHD